MSGSKTKNPINFVDRVHVLEAASGFEPENNGFAGRRLTTWPSRRNRMERETRFELATSTLARLHSTTELFPLSVCALHLAKTGSVVTGDGVGVNRKKGDVFI